jgi:hypothetical protein
MKIGDRIKLLEMPNDPDPIPAGTCGVITGINPIGAGEFQIIVKWEIGRSLMLILPHDKIKVISKEE